MFGRSTSGAGIYPAAHASPCAPMVGPDVLCGSEEIVSIGASFHFLEQLPDRSDRLLGEALAFQAMRERFESLGERKVGHFSAAQNQGLLQKVTSRAANENGHDDGNESRTAALHRDDSVAFELHVQRMLDGFC